MFLFAQNALCCNKRQRIIAVKISETGAQNFLSFQGPGNNSIQQKLNSHIFAYLRYCIHSGCCGKLYFIFRDPRIVYMAL